MRCERDIIMDNMIEELYFGREHDKAAYTNVPAIRTALASIEWAENYLLSALKGKEKVILIQLVNDYDNLVALIGLEEFKNGYLSAELAEM